MMLRAKAYAKINLSLDIVGVRDDGYHLIKTVMQSISLHDVVGVEKTAGCMIGFGATMLPNGDVNVTSGGELKIGRVNGRIDAKITELGEIYKALLPTKVVDNIDAQLYSKLIINSCINATAGITGKTLGVIIDDSRAGKLFLAITREGMHVAKAMGINVPKYGKLLEYRLLMLMDNAPYNAICRFIVKLVAKIKYADVKPSTLQSLERGELTEIDIFNGYIAAKGKEYGVETPVNTKLTAMIHEIERKERPITPDNLDEFKGILFK